MASQEEKFKEYICDRICQFPHRLDQEHLDHLCETCPVSNTQFIIHNDGGNKWLRK